MVPAPLYSCCTIELAKPSVLGAPTALVEGKAVDLV